MRKQVLTASLLLVLAAGGLQAMSEAERRDYLQWMQASLPDNPPFNEWLKKSGELPPDFDQLPRSNALPDPLKFMDGRPVKTDADWAARKNEIRALFEKYITGTFPPKPKIENVVVLDEAKFDGYTTRNVKLEFGPDRKGSVRVQLSIPDAPGKYPVLLGSNLAGWGPTVIRRGYISAGYGGNDFMDDGANLREVYPGYDFAALPRRAWLAHVVLDYLETVPQVDMKRVALTGYSRDGKMATIAAAFDERISALLAGSTGVGGLLPWRTSGERGGGESVETTTRMFPTWLVERSRFFSGKEDRLPVDANLFLALIAPRAVLIEWGHNDEVSNGWGIEQGMASAQKVYDRLGQPNRLGVIHVPGFHGSNDMEASIDWLDYQFGRSQKAWVNDYAFPWSFDSWRKLSNEQVDLGKFAKHDKPATFTTTGDWEKRSAELKKSIDWALGENPLKMPATGRGSVPPRFANRPPPPGPTTVAKGNVGNPGQLYPDVPAWVIGRGGQEFGWLEPEKDQVDSKKVRFAGGLSGDLYYPANTPAGTKLPTVVWLHGFNYPLGYMWVYRRDLHPILALVKAGYAVMAYDQVGFGARWTEAKPFYDRWPHWSQIGRMVEDARGAIDALQDEALVDAKRISLFGYTLGGTVALYTAAIDSRVKGVVSVSGFTPMRTDTLARGTSGMTRYSHERGLIPRLGFFAGQESKLPYDYDDLISWVAPRPTLIVSPTMDRDANPADIRAAVERARSIYSLYGAPTKLGLDEPKDFARLPAATQERAIEWMKANF